MKITQLAKERSFLSGESPLDLLARAGLFSRGTVYVILGLIAVGSSVYSAQEERSTSGALSFLRDLPFGSAVLFALSAGLLLFSLWRFSQSIFNADNRDGRIVDWGARIGQFSSGLVYLSLAGFAFQLALGWTDGDNGGSGTESIVRLLMQQPFGPWLVGGAALILGGVGVSQIWRGVTQNHLKRTELPETTAPILKTISTWGICARGLMFVIAGGFMMYAAITVNPSQAGSLSDALDWLRGLPFGFYLYLAAALGLLSYGLFGIIQAFYRHVDVDGYDKGDFTFDFPILKRFVRSLKAP